MVYKSGQIFLPFCHNPRVCRTDGQTDRQTEFSSLDRVCIPCSAVKTSLLRVNIAPSLPPFYPPPKHFKPRGPENLKSMQMLINNMCLKWRELSIFVSMINRGRGTRLWRQILDPKYKCGRITHAQWKICNIILIGGRIAKFSRIGGNRGWGYRSLMKLLLFQSPTFIGTVRSLWTWLRFHRTYF